MAASSGMSKMVSTFTKLLVDPVLIGVCSQDVSFPLYFPEGWSLGHNQPGFQAIPAASPCRVVPLPARCGPDSTNATPS